MASNNVINITITGITKGLNRAVRETERALRRLNDNFGGTAKSAAKAALGITKGVGAVAALGAGASAAVSAIGGLGASIGAMVPLLGLLPAAGAAGAAAISTLIVGFQGLGDAMSATDPAEYAEALDKLSPSARQVVRQLKSLAPAARELRLDVQERLMRGWGQEVAAVGHTYLPLLTRGMGKVADSFNESGRQLAAFLRESRTVKDINLLFDDTSNAIGNMNPGIRAVLQAFRDIGITASEFLPGMANGFSNAAKRFAAFIAEARKTGQLKALIQNAINTFKDLVAVVSNVARIVFTFFGAANTYGLNFLGTLKNTTGQMLAFLQSSRGAQFLSQIFTGLRAILDGLRPVLREIGRAFVEYIAPAIQKFGQVAGQAFAKFLPAIDPLMKALGDLLPILAEIASIVAGVLSNAIQRLSPYVAPLGRFFAQLLKACEPLIDAFLDIATSLLDALMPVLPDLVDAFKAVITPVTDLVKIAGPPLVAIFKALLPVIKPVAEVLGVLLSILKPIFEVIGWIIERLADFITWLTNTASAVLGFMGVTDGVTKKFVKGTGQGFTDLSGKSGSLVSKLHAHTQNMIEDYEKAKRGIQTSLGAAGNATTSFFTKASGNFNKTKTSGNSLIDRLNVILRSQLAGAVGAGVSSLSRLPTGASRAGEQARAALARYVAGIRGMFNGQRGSFFSAGYSLVSNLGAGMTAAIGSAVSAARRVVGAIGSFLPHSPAKQGEFSGTGWTPYRGKALVRGLAQGMLKEIPTLEAATAKVMSSLGAGFDSQIGAGGINPTVNQYSVSVSAGVGDPVAIGKEVDKALTAFRNSGGRR